MAYIVSDRYKQIIYSGDARNKLKLLFNNVELQDADRYCEKLTIKSRIIPNGAKIFSLNNFISKEAELILHDIDTSIIQNQVSISIGTLVGNSYEYVPIGIFNIENQPTNDKNRTTIKLRDNSVKFDFNYNAQPLIEENGGSATKLQILRDICSQAGVTCNITSFIGYLDEIGVYDNTITAREYISRIAEQAGKIATINRSGELIFVDLNNLTTWEIPINIVEKYENGTKFKIGRVVYEDGIVRYETPSSDDDTLFLDSSNNYINNEKVLLQARSNDNQYHLENTNDDNLTYMEIYGQTIQETEGIGKNILLIGNVSNTLGLTITRVANSEIRISGMTSGAGTINIPLGASYTLSSVPYTFSITSTGTINKNIFISLYQSASLNNLSMSSASTASLTSTNENGRVINAIQIVVQSATRFTNFDMKFQLEQGTSATTFEQYTYPMPSPDYPSELVSVGYENLFDKNSVTNGYYLNASGGLDANANYCVSDFIPVISGEQYYIPVRGTTRTLYYLSDKTRYSNNWDVTDQAQVITIPNNVAYIRMSIAIAGNTAIDIDTFQFTKGTQAHSYIPYGKYGIEVKTTGKNLFNKDNIILNKRLDSNGELSVTDNSYCTTNYFIKAKPNTTYYSTQQIGGSRCVCCYDENMNHLQRLIYLNKNVFTTVDNTAYIKVSLLKENIDEEQLEQGNEATTYEPYKLNTYLYQLDEPLRSINDIKDLLYIKNGYLYVDRKIGSVVLNGSENTYYYYQSNENYHQINAVLGITNINTTDRSLIASNYFKYYSGAVNSNKSESGILKYGLNPNFVFSIPNSLATSVNGFKTWLSTHNTEVQYVLAEPYTETLGAIEVPSTYKGVTYIDIDSNIYTDSYVKYRKEETQLEAILEETNQFNIDSLKTGKILGNPAIDSYDLIQIHDKSKNLFNKNATINTEFTSSIADALQNYKNNNVFAKGYFDTPTNNKLITSNIYITAFIPISEGQTYTAYPRYDRASNWNFAQIFNLDDEGNIISYSSRWIEVPYTHTPIAQEKYMAFSMRIDSMYPVLDTAQVEISPNATDYVPFKDETYTTLATNDLVYTGVLINTFDTQIGEEAKEQNVFINGEETFKKWARTKIDNVEGTLTLQAGEINEVNGKINSTTLQINSQGALLNVLANNSNIDVEYDNDGNPLSGEVREVTTTTGFTFNAEGMTIEDSNSNFKALHRNDGTYYKEGEEIVGQYTKDGSKQKDLQLFGVYYYGMRDKDDTPMFVAQLYNDNNGEECFGHFYNRGD